MERDRDFAADAVRTEERRHVDPRDGICVGDERRFALGPIGRHRCDSAQGEQPRAGGLPLPPPAGRDDRPALLIAQDAGVVARQDPRRLFQDDLVERPEVQRAGQRRAHGRQRLRLLELLLTQAGQLFGYCPRLLHDLFLLFALGDVGNHSQAAGVPSSLVHDRIGGHVRPQHAAIAAEQANIMRDRSALAVQVQLGSSTRSFVLMQQREDRRAHQLSCRVAQQVCHLLVDERGPMLRITLPDTLLRSLHDTPILLFACAQVRFCSLTPEALSQHDDAECHGVRELGEQSRLFGVKGIRFVGVNGEHSMHAAVDEQREPQHGGIATTCHARAPGVRGHVRPDVLHRRWLPGTYRRADRAVSERAIVPRHRDRFQIAIRVPGHGHGAHPLAGIVLGDADPGHAVAAHLDHCLADVLLQAGLVHGVGVGVVARAEGRQRAIGPAQRRDGL